jgi:hypothetical protein
MYFVVMGIFAFLSMIISLFIGYKVGLREEIFFVVGIVFAAISNGIASFWS